MKMSDEDIWNSMQCTEVGKAIQLNGLDSFLQTFFQVTEYFAKSVNSVGTLAQRTISFGSYTLLFNLAKYVTAKFELANPLYLRLTNTEKGKSFSVTAPRIQSIVVEYIKTLEDEA